MNLTQYSIVVIPPMKNILRNTVSLLKLFMDAGGKVVAAGELPTLVDGVPSDEVLELASHDGFQYIEDPGDVPFTMESILLRKVSIKNKNGCEADSFLYMLRELEDSRILFVVNKDRFQGQEVEITLISL
ncbi:hypothetical protein ABE504_08815 [Paenibacillus oryzisoli]|uniref:hypothetical protein n=1 Tax=Paenibacillus oryzisoli TaxID=1850517 RepID=UPI003D28A4BC